MDFFANSSKQKHFVLVHGAGHGAWCWYKLKPLLESTGQRVTAIDLSASGINTKSLDEIHTLHDYAEPLMEFMAAVPPDQKVILVGHSFGGYCLALAMEHFPEKISIAVFVAAFMPDTIHDASYVGNQFAERFPAEDMLDSEYFVYGSSEEPRTVMSVGPKFLEINAYQLCSMEDLELSKLLVRPTHTLNQHFPKANKFSADKYGSVQRAYIICSQDRTFLTSFQHWLVENIGATEVREIKEADHMAMLSKPQELCKYLLDIANKVHLS
ncbi:polyneuridine-aldehyde esterase-like [Coffea eugenioides]|uniref:polyneuridine-aldehyde esterase-like n=1 Tax=Coffea eugenioides TaxID=49369 RepID=UPI000F60AC7B|nr:polyneuridine-aldehyde esterase-like [Coffea eugenioides]